MPVRNEKDYIQAALSSLVVQDFNPGDLEILCIDGLSQDGTREIIIEYAERFPRIKLVENPRKITSAALNLGIKHSTGDVVIRVDAHSQYPANYISKLTDYLFSLQADNVGGVCIAFSSDTSQQARAINTILTSRLGVGNSLFRVGVDRVREVDTVPFGCYRRSTLDRIGPYDERLYRTEDYELNQRLRKAGGRIFIVPDVQIQYFPPKTFLDFFRKQFSNGYGVLETALVFGKISYHSVRHYTPLCFVLYLLGLTTLFYAWTWFWLPLVAYGTMILSFGFFKAIEQRNPFSVLMLPVGLAGTHLSYGCGSLFSLLKAPRKIMQRNNSLIPNASV